MCACALVFICACVCVLYAQSVVLLEWEKWAGTSPLTHRVVDLVALATADGDGVKVQEGPQPHPRDGHQVGPELDQDGLGVVEGRAQVVGHRDDQGVVPAAEPPIP